MKDRSVHRTASRLVRAALWLFLPPAVLLGCSDDDVVAPSSSACPPDNEVGGVCAGAPLAVCDSDVCSEGVVCQRVVSAANDEVLQSSLATLTPGTCVSLAPGDYSWILLPADVHLLGSGAGAVTVAGVETNAGGVGQQVIRGMTVGALGVKAFGGSMRLESVVVSGAGTGIDDGLIDAGVLVLGGAQVDMFRVTVDGSTRHGVLVDSGGSLNLQASIVSGSEGPGIWAACADGCACAGGDRPQVSISDSIIRDNRLAGVALTATDATVMNSDILRTKVGDTFFFGEGGGGLSVAQCSNIDAEAVRVRDNASFGVLVDDSTAALGGPDTAQALEVTGNLRGIWLQNIAASAPGTAHVENVTLAGNAGVGLGFGGGDVGIIIICKTAVNDTELALLPVFENAMDLGTSQSLGDGVEWLGGANVQLEQVSLSGNARASILIDGPATGSLLDVTLSGGDEVKGIVQQSYDGSGPQPTVGANVPPLVTSASEQLAVSKPPAVLSPL